MKMNKMIMKIVIAGVILAWGTNALAADDTGYALLLQSSPVDGGNITPGGGVHKVQAGSQMQLSAVPRAGYRFLYWVGDVGQMGSSETSVEMSGPKMVIAVFVREQFEGMLPAGIIGGPATGGTYSSAPSSGSSRGYGTAIGYGDYESPVIPQSPEDDNGTIVPEVPEPATLLLLASGAVLLARRQRKQS